MIWSLGGLDRILVFLNSDHSKPCNLGDLLFLTMIQGSYPVLIMKFNIGT